MLIMITNRCFENCPHCMENSNPEGQMMDGRTFHKAVMFAKYIGCSVVALSGGEPTTHPDFFKFCKALNDDYKMPFTVVSNGTWCLDCWGEININDWLPFNLVPMAGVAPSKNRNLNKCGLKKEGIDIIEERNKHDPRKIERQIRRMCSDFKYFIGMQVYTNKLFYKDYDLIHGKKSFFDSFGGKVILDESPIRSMQDLGRAKTCELAQKMCDESRYNMSCLNSALCAKQVDYSNLYGKTLERTAMHFCHPMVDFDGFVHLSESWLCPHVGNVTRDLFDDIWVNMCFYQPCGRCKGYKKFRESTDPKIVMARQIMKGEI